MVRAPSDGAQGSPAPPGGGVGRPRPLPAAQGGQALPCSGQPWPFPAAARTGAPPHISTPYVIFFTGGTRGGGRSFYGDGESRFGHGGSRSGGREPRAGRDGGEYLDLASGCGSAWMGSVGPSMGLAGLSTVFFFLFFYLINRGGHLNRLGQATINHDLSTEVV